MSGLLKRLSARMNQQLNPNSESDLDRMIEKAQAFMRRQIKGWFELPPLLAAWRLNQREFIAPPISTPEVLNPALDDVKECAEPTGLIARDPARLPGWVTDHWQLSKQTVNHLFTGNGEFERVPHRVLNESLTAELSRAWGTKDSKRGKLLQDWMVRASAHVVDNLPAAVPSH